MLNQEQLNAIAEIRKWWVSPQEHFILHGKAGTGKTFLTNEAIKALPGAKPLITAPTNAAVKQLGKRFKKLDQKYLKTTFSAFNVHMSCGQEKKELIQSRFPDFDGMNLLIIDEASFLGEQKNIKIDPTIKTSLFDLTKSAGIKTLYIGHQSQLPEVQEGKNIDINARCSSVVFTQDFTRFDLTQSMRAQGELEKAHDYLESLIYKQAPVFKNEWKITKHEINDYLNSIQGKYDLLEGNVSMLAYTNKQINENNALIRQILFNTKLPWIKHDRIILTQPVQTFGKLQTRFSESDLIKTKKWILESNSQGIIEKIGYTIINNLECWELTVDMEGEIVYLYVPRNKEDFEEYKKHMRVKMLASEKSKEKGWKKYHAIIDLFANVNHNYSITVHRAQGATIPKVIVDWRDIQKCYNLNLRHKLLYVAGSRSSEQLWIKN